MSCTTAITSLSTECQFRAAKLPEVRYAYVSADTKNFKVRVSATFSVLKGASTWPSPVARRAATQRSGRTAASVQCDAAINRSTFAFTIEAKPREGGAEGLAGSLTFRPI